MGEVLYDTAKCIDAPDTVLSEAFSALEATARQPSECGRARLYDLQLDNLETMKRFCIGTCAMLDCPTEEQTQE